MTRLIPFWMKLVFLLAVIAAAFGAGWEIRSWKAESDRVAELSGYIAATKRSIAKDKEVAGQIGRLLNDHAAQREQDRLTFEEKLRHVSGKSLVRVVRPKCPAAPTDRASVARVPPLPVADGDSDRVLLTGVYIGLHNDALAIGSTQAERAGRVDAATEGAGVVEPKEVLANLKPNAERWAECRTRLRGFQAWACGHGFADAALCVDVTP